jgi:hypothetical protein
MAPEAQMMAPQGAVRGRGAFRKIATGVGITAAIVGGAALGAAGGWAIAPILGIVAGASGAPGTAFVGAVMGAGLFGGTASRFLKDNPQRRAQEVAGGAGISEKQLRRWAVRNQLDR